MLPPKGSRGTTGTGPPPLPGAPSCPGTLRGCVPLPKRRPTPCGTPRPPPTRKSGASTGEGARAGSPPPRPAGRNLGAALRAGGTSTVPLTSPPSSPGGGTSSTPPGPGGIPPWPSPVTSDETGGIPPPISSVRSAARSAILALRGKQQGQQDRPQGSQVKLGQGGHPRTSCPR